MRRSSAEQETSLFSFPLLNLQGRRLLSRRRRGEVGEVLLLQWGSWKSASLDACLERMGFHTAADSSLQAIEIFTSRAC